MKMKKLAIIAILLISVLLIGCAQKEISAMSDKEYKSSKSTASSGTTEKTVVISNQKTDTTTTTTDDSSSTPRAVTVKESTTGEDVTLKKLDTYKRGKEVTETCYLGFPLECAKYFAKDGIVYLSIKNAGYTSKINQVVLTLDNEECDPTETYIETGQLKDFECFVDSGIDYVSGTLEMEYYSKIDQKHFTKTGQLVVMME